MEHIRTPKVDNVRLQERFGSRRPSEGTLYLTATHLIFVESPARVRKETWILHNHIGSVEKLPTTPLGCPLLVRCKNFQLATFVMARERDCHDIFTSLLKLARPVLYEELYAFSYNPKEDEGQRAAGWALLSVDDDYARMALPAGLWARTDMNREYRVCETYPSELYVPTSVSPAVISASAKFRSKGRFPVLSYYHRDTAACLCRCAQPLSGLSARCVEDEQLLQAVRHANTHSSEFLYVVDTRPKINAMANRAAGKGYENEDNYSHIRFHFMGIENIHVMRASLAKLLDVCQTKNLSSGDFLTGLEASGWLRHIKAVLDTAAFIAKALVDEGVSVLVHCSDGWDRTAQVCALALLLTDPHYRSLHGFMVLVEKEWISFGHKFSHRCAHIEGEGKEVSPVFAQFLECVWHLTERFPAAFQFNERLLLQLHDHVHSCQFGNFLGNSQRERRQLRIEERTYSLWAHLTKHSADFTNPLYRPDSSLTALRPHTAPCLFKFWRGMYNRFETGMHPRQCVGEVLTTLTNRSMELRRDVEELEVKLSAIQALSTNQPPSTTTGSSTTTSSTTTTTSSTTSSIQPSLPPSTNSPLLALRSEDGADDDADDDDDDDDLVLVDGLSLSCDGEVMAVED